MGNPTGCRARPGRVRRDDRGAAVVDFVLVLLVLVPLVLGIAQVALVLHVRDTLASAAAEGARLAATQGEGPAAGEARTRQLVEDAVSSRYADDIDVREVTVDGVREVEVVVHAKVPALGLGGPAVSMSVTGHAVEEDQ